MMSLNINDLIETFEKAKRTNSSFVFVGIEAEGVQETICIPSRSFDEKQSFYERSYTSELVHVMNKNVFIRGMSYGEADQLNIIG